MRLLILRAPEAFPRGHEGDEFQTMRHFARITRFAAKAALDAISEDRRDELHASDIVCGLRPPDPTSRLSNPIGRLPEKVIWHSLLTLDSAAVFSIPAIKPAGTTGPSD